jgi:single-stranded DNA-binding protein
MVEGRLRTRNWQIPEGQKRSATEVVAERVQFLGSPNAARDQAAATSSPEPEPAAAADEPPF